MKVGKTICTVLLLCKLIWKIMLFTVIVWNFYFILYSFKSMV